MSKDVAKKIFWMGFTTVLSILTIWALLRQNQSMSFEKLLELISKSDKKWMVAAIASADRRLYS
ncbi:MAG: hypothetical protein IKW81_07060 [Pseudobutyrivibrio sp.]|nr:hypothetical protein [Pseudobutyrivibrio sp.]